MCLLVVMKSNITSGFPLSCPQKSEIFLGVYPCYRQTVKRCSASEVSSDTILDLQATLGSHLSLEQPNAAYSLPNTSKRLAEAAIKYPIAFVKEQCKSSDDGIENRGEGIQKPLRNTKMEPIC